DRAAACVVDYGTNAQVNLKSGQTYGTSHSVMLTNLQPGTLYYLRVSATANGATGTQVATATTATYQAIEWSAESAVIALPMKIVNDGSVESGKYIVSSAPSNVQVSYNLSLLR